MTQDLLTRPPTEVEIAEALTTCKYASATPSPGVADVIRRLAFQLDQLKAQLREHSYWVACSKARPPSSGFFMVWMVSKDGFTGPRARVDYYSHDMDRWDKQSTNNITHWRPLVKGPDEADNGTTERPAVAGS